MKLCIGLVCLLVASCKPEGQKVEPAGGSDLRTMCGNINKGIDAYRQARTRKESGQQLSNDPPGTRRPMK